MLPTGDDLSVLLFCCGLVAAATIAAAQSSGRSRSGFIIAAIALGLLTAGVWANPLKIAWSKVLPYANAAVVPGTLLMAALMVRSMKRELIEKTRDKDRIIAEPPPPAKEPETPKRSAYLAPSDPSDRYKSKTKSHFEPDIELSEGVQRLTSGASIWVDPNGRRTQHGAINELHRALRSGQITAWARLHPDSEEFQVGRDEWIYAHSLRADGYAQLSNVAIYKVRLARDEVEAAWPNR